MTSKITKIIIKIEKDLDKNYTYEDMSEDDNDITFTSIVIRNLPKKCFVPFDIIRKWKIAYLIGELNNIKLGDYIEQPITPEEKKIKRNEQKNTWLKQWAKDKKYHCEICDKEMSYMSKSDHSRSKKHLKKIDEINNPPVEPVAEPVVEN